MKMFCTDLDNTLIYSYKREIGEEKRCVEIYKDKEISFITEKSIQLLTKIAKKAMVVPVTTRTVEQYQRIELGIGVPKYALTCNGGVLLKDGEKDMCWYYDSLKLAETSWDELWKSQDILKYDKNRSMEVQFIEELFVFTKSTKPEETVHKLMEKLDLSKMDIFSNGVKIYAIPKNLTKGNAIRRLREALGIEYVTAKGENIFDLMITAAKTAAGNEKYDLSKVIAENTEFDLTMIAAGDSEIDLTMIEQADMGIIPELLLKKWPEEKRLKNKYIIIEKDKIYSDELLKYIFEKVIE